MINIFFSCEPENLITKRLGKSYYSKMSFLKKKDYMINFLDSIRINQRYLPLKLCRYSFLHKKPLKTCRNLQVRIFLSFKMKISFEYVGK